MNQMKDLLAHGDLRTKGLSEEVVSMVKKNPKLFGELFPLLFDDDRGVVMRAADALEKLSKIKPDLLMPYKQELIKRSVSFSNPELCWHVAQMFGYLQLNREENIEVLNILQHYVINTKSNIVKVFSLQTMTQIAIVEKELKTKVREIITNEMKSGSPSVTSRGKKLLKMLEL